MHEEKRSWLLAGTWLVVVALLCYLVPHQQIAGKLRAVWGVTAWQTLVAHLVVLAAWYGAYFIHIRLGPEEDEPTPLWKPVAQGVIWAVATGLTIELCLAWFLAGKPNSFALFLSGLVIFLSHHSGVWGLFRALMLDTPFFMGFIVLSGTVIGFYLQIAEMQKKQAGTSG